MSGGPADAAPTAAAGQLIDAVDTEPAPLRLVLGSDAWAGGTAALEARLEQVRGQE
ncbi:MAG: short-chain dehydrogenase/reductase, partial [Micrococcales bacterium]|nr:short-chain dehydrogenase/reductase [Micrococcales bacterium]